MKQTDGQSVCSQGWAFCAQCLCWQRRADSDFKEGFQLPQVGSTQTRPWLIITG
jgi:hypothetical protein